MYSIFVDKYVFNTLENKYLSYQSQRDSILVKLPQESLTLSGNENTTPVFLITQNEINAVNIYSNIDFDYGLSERVAENKKYAIKIYEYCYDSTPPKKGISVYHAIEFNTLCEGKNISSERKDNAIIQTLQSLSDISIAYEQSKYETWHKFPFTEKVRSWK